MIAWARAIDAHRCYFAKVICGKFAVEKSMKNADFARVPILVVTYVNCTVAVSEHDWVLEWCGDYSEL
jgi:hypothetical protein